MRLTIIFYPIFISNFYEIFYIRHNDYLNGAKHQREALNDSQFVEYLYNRAYALLYLLRLKQCNQDGQECEVIGI